MLLLLLSAYLACAFLLLTLCFTRILIPFQLAKSKPRYRFLLGLYFCAFGSGVVGLISRSLYLKHFVEQHLLQTEQSSSVRSSIEPLLYEISEYVFGNQVRYFLGIQGYLALISWSVYMGLEGRVKKRIPNLWILLLLTPIVSFACAQALFYLALEYYSSIPKPKQDDRNIFASFTDGPETALLCAYILGPALPLLYDTPVFIVAFLAAYTLPVLLIYLPYKLESTEDLWDTIRPWGRFIHTWQILVVAVSINWIAEGGLHSLIDIGWSWTEHPVLRALLVDLVLSGAVLMYWATSFPDTRPLASTRGSSPEVDTLHTSAIRSVFYTALNIAGTGLGAASASAYESYFRTSAK